MSCSTPAAEDRARRCSEPARVCVVQLGCPKNRVDGELMMGLLRAAGFELVLAPEDADVVVVNTCAFIRAAEQEAIDTILALTANRSTPVRLIVAGCLAQKRGGALLREISEIRGLVGPGRLDRIASVTRAVLADEPPPVALGGFPCAYPDAERERTGSPFTAYVKIAEGCDHRCAYCLIPALRGRQRSRAMESIVAEADALAAEGTREIILVAQDTTAYGLDLCGKPLLAELARRLSDRDGPDWIRVLYTHPDHWTDDLIDLFAAGGRLLPYVDVPIQHVAAPVLRAMRRRDSGDAIRALLERLRARIPNVILRSTVMTGHPGEGPAEFERLLEFLREFPFDRLGAFAYSPETGTVASRLRPRPSRREALRRRHEVLSLQREIARELQQRRKGARVDALIEGIDVARGLRIGRSYGEAPEIDGLIRIRTRRTEAMNAPEPGDIIPVRITAAGAYDLRAVYPG